MYTYYVIKFKINIKRDYFLISILNTYTYVITYMYFFNTFFLK